MKNKLLLFVFFLSNLITTSTFAQSNNQNNDLETLKKKQMELAIKKQQFAINQVDLSIARQASEMKVISNQPTPNNIPLDKTYKTKTVKKMYKNESATKEVTFKVVNDYEKYINEFYNAKLIIKIEGECKTGTIKITIFEPSGKKFKEIIIDQSANLTWTQSFFYGLGKKHQGVWKAKIEAKNANGFYTLSFLDTFSFPEH